MEDFQKTFREMTEDSREKTLVDLRKEEDFRKDSYDGALHIYWEEFDIQNPPVPKDKPLYLLCYTGETSDEIAQLLRKDGYEAYSIAEGFRGYLRWKLAGLCKHSL